MDKPDAATGAEPVTTEQHTSPSKTDRHLHVIATVVGRGDSAAVS
jgi:hypothetical protein